MKTLYLLRHADALSGPDDHERPLSMRGREEALAAAAFLSESAGGLPEMLLASSARRAQETADIMMQRACRESACVRSDVRQLYLAAADVIFMHISAVSDACSGLMIVGHNPGVTEAFLRLGGQAVFPTAGLAVLESRAKVWAEISPANIASVKFFTPA